MPSVTPHVDRILFVALGEREVQAFEHIASALELEGLATCQVATWLPRLASERTRALERVARSVRLSPGEVDEALSKQRLPDASMAADCDRDWYFAKRSAKRNHVHRVYSALSHVFDEFDPTLLVSSVGGETTRRVVSAIARERAVPTAFFNAVPIPGRYVLLRDLDAPFIPFEGTSSSYRPISHPPPAYPSGSKTGPSQPRQGAAMRDGPDRLWRQMALRERSYPKTWVFRRSYEVVRDATLRRISWAGVDFEPAHPVKILYPLHDERDFQVVVRERHALPQWSLISYLSSQLPPGHHLYVKAHPQHLAQHHPILWRVIGDLPNVHFLPPHLSASEAITDSDVVFTLASSLGFEALQLGKPVVCYGTPFYSRRGLTYDVDDPRRIVEALKSAIGQSPAVADLHGFVELMLSWSWGGAFAPLSLEPSNLDHLVVGIREVVGQA